MNYPAASGGVSKKTKIFGAASGGEPSARRSIAKSPIKLNIKNKSDSKGAFGNAPIESPLGAPYHRLRRFLGFHPIACCEARVHPSAARSPVSATVRETRYAICTRSQKVVRGVRVTGPVRPDLRGSR
jgi:hypothetical protein